MSGSVCAVNGGGNLNESRSSSITDTATAADCNMTSTLVKNFRRASGLPFIYRCASTDLLGDLFDDAGEDNIPNTDTDTNTNKFAHFDNDSPEKKLLYDIGLVLDLRSQSERNELKAKKWTSLAPGGKYITKTFERGSDITNDLGFRGEIGEENQQRRRVIYRIDVLSPQRLFDYMSKSWISSPSQRTKYMFNVAFDSKGLHEMRMDIMNEKGLEGLYEAIIETSDAELFASLKAIVEYLEVTQETQNDTGTGAGTDRATTTTGSCGGSGGRGVVVHCVQGKDRTGLVIMLCQSILGLSDEVIVSDYNLSERLLNRGEGSSAASTVTAAGIKQAKKGKLSREIFSGSPAVTMISTLGAIRRKYGSINGYLDSIGFDSAWRDRLISVSTLTAGEAALETSGSEGQSEIGDETVAQVPRSKL